MEKHSEDEPARDESPKTEGWPGRLTLSLDLLRDYAGK